MTLDPKVCQEIAQSYLDQGQDMSFFKKVFSDSFYSGQHSTYWIRDWLAGGSTNNFLLNYFRRSDYANFIKFVENVCLEAPNAEEILNLLKTATSLDQIYAIIVANNENYITSKCFYDLSEDFNQHKRPHIPVKVQDYNEKKRKAETESRRIAKILCTGYEICQGFIEMMGILGFTFVTSLASPYLIGAMIGTFIVASYLNYSLGKEETTKFILRFKMGNHFKRDRGAGQEPEEFTFSEKALVIFFESCSVFAAFCAFALAASAMYGLMPTLGVYALSVFILPPTCLIFTNSVYKFIDQNGLKGLKDYFSKRFNSDASVFELLYEGIKLVSSFLMSILVSYATYMMLRTKAFGLILYTPLKASAYGLSILAAGVTAGLKTSFIVSKLTQLFESIGHYLFKQEKTAEPVHIEKGSEKKSSTKSMFDGLKRKDQVIANMFGGFKLGAAVIHSVSEAGLVKAGFDDPGASAHMAFEETGAIGGKGAYSFISMITSIFKGKKYSEKYEIPDQKSSSSLRPGASVVTE